MPSKCIFYRLYRDSINQYNRSTTCQIQNRDPGLTIGLIFTPEIDRDREFASRGASNN